MPWIIEENKFIPDIFNARLEVNENEKLVSKYFATHAEALSFIEKCNLSGLEIIDEGNTFWQSVEDDKISSINDWDFTSNCVKKPEDIKVLFAEHGEWSDKTFTYERSFTGPLNHLKKEIEEVKENGDLMEFADCLLLILDAFRRRHRDLSITDLICAAHQKLQVNKNRVWQKPNADGSVEHDRTNDHNQK